MRHTKRIILVLSIFSILVSCSNKSENVKIVEMLVKYMNTGKFDKASDLLADDLVTVSNVNNYIGDKEEYMKIVESPEMQWLTPKVTLLSITEDGNNIITQEETTYKTFNKYIDVPDMKYQKAYEINDKKIVKIKVDTLYGTAKYMKSVTRELQTFGQWRLTNDKYKFHDTTSVEEKRNIIKKAVKDYAKWRNTD